jgi:hypothetical protein
MKIIVRTLGIEDKAMIRDQIMKIAENEPQFAKAVDIMEEQVAQMPIVPKDLDKEIQMLEFVLQNPDKYEEVRAAAIKDGYIQEDMVPPQFDQVFIISLLVALYGLQDRLKQRGYARGGLKVAGRQLADMGRGGDDMVAHINHREAEVLRRMGGAGTINPNTGLHEYKKGGILGMILPVALSIIAPGLGTAIGSAIGLSGTAASMVGGALIGAGTSAITGGNPLMGALTGGIMPAVSGALGGTDGLFSKMGITGENGILGNVFGGATPTPEGSVDLTKAMGSALDSPANIAAEAALNGVSPQDASAAFGSPLNTVASSLNTGAPNTPDVTKAMGSALNSPANIEAEAALNNVTAKDAMSAYGGTSSPSSSVIDTIKNGLGFGEKGSGLSLSKLAPLAMMASSLMGGQKIPAATAASMTPEQQAYFNKSGYSWDWDAIGKAASQEGKSISDYVAQHWDEVGAGQKFKVDAAGPTVAAAHGGALGHISRLARGSGSGRDDTINARLSDGEYVIDAETVALLGDGSTDAGAKRLDEMRKQIRMQKGKSLSKGKFSPDAKSPLSYLKGVA